MHAYLHTHTHTFCNGSVIFTPTQYTHRHIHIRTHTRSEKHRHHSENSSKRRRRARQHFHNRLLHLSPQKHHPLRLCSHTRRRRRTRKTSERRLPSTHRNATRNGLRLLYTPHTRREHQTARTPNGRPHLCIPLTRHRHLATAKQPPCPLLMYMQIEKKRGRPPFSRTPHLLCKIL
jgi:hypothetical protein